MSIPWRLYFRHIVVWPLPLPCKQKHSADARIHLACLFTRTFTLWHRHLYFLRFPSLGMLSPRTMSLRIKSKVLLQAVDKYLSMTSQNDFYDKINIDGINNCITNLELDHPIQLDAFRSSSPNSNGDRSDSKKRVATSSETFEEKEKHRFQDKYQSPVLASKMKIDQSRTQSNESQARAVTITSRTRSAEQKEDLISTDTLRLKGMGYINSKNSTHHKSKSVSILQQQRAAEAQMHAPTHSHSTSKCYCRNSNYVREQPDKRYVVQVHGLKQHIPDRLKRTRYRADSIPKQSKSIKWADCKERLFHSCADDVSLPSPRTCKLHKDLSESPHSISNQSALGSHASQSTLLDKVKMFRESHWSDCHASRDSMVPLHHNCAFHYVPNRRLFLEPVHINNFGDETCPVCFLPSNNCQKSGQQGTDVVDSTYEDNSSHIMVTLPLHMLKSESHAVCSALSFHKDKRENFPLKKKCCFNVEHHKWNSQTSLRNPTDSLALRFQKKC